MDNSRNNKQPMITKDKFHPNSLTRKTATNEDAPTLPTYNVKQYDRDRVAGYLSRLDKRLSQPKLSSPAMQMLRQSSQDSRVSMERLPMSVTAQITRKGSAAELPERSSF